MEVRILGPLEVWGTTGQVKLVRAKERALLGVLVVNANRMVSEARLMEVLWPDGAPPSAAKSLLSHVSRLRRALLETEDPQIRLVSRPGGYVLEMKDEAIDAARAEAALEQAQVAMSDRQPGRASVVISSALRLWRGEPFSELADQPWAVAERHRLDELRMRLVEERAEAELACGRHAALVPELEQECTRHPYRERPWGQLILALYRSGRQAEALQAYARLRTTLAEELGIDPSEPLRELERAVLNQAPSLTGAGPRPEGGRPTLPPAARGGALFVGRSRELARLDEAFDGARDGGRAVVLVAGEPGIGKTRLAGRFAERCYERGATVLHGRCDEDLGVGYQPFVEALGAYVRHGPADVLAGHVLRHGGELARLVPELHQRIPDAPAPLQHAPDGERLRLFDAVSGLLQDAAGTDGLVLVLDDLHWAAAPTLLLLRHLVRTTPPRGVLLLGTYRDTEIGRTHPLAETIADLRTQDSFTRLQLSGLSEPDLLALVERLSGVEDAASAAFARQLRERTEGNPFFAREVFRHIVETGGVSHSEQGWQPTEHFDLSALPEGVRDVVGRRLSRLADRTNRVLAVASVAGPSFEPAVVEHVLRDEVDREELLDALDEAVQAGIVTELPDGHGSYAFAHSLIRQTLYDELTTARRVRMHQRIGAALESLHSHALDEHLAELAHHFAQAAGEETQPKAAGYALRAGHKALSQVAYEEAASFATTGLAALESTGPEPSALKTDLLLLLAETRRILLDQEGAVEAALQAAELATRAGADGKLAAAARTATMASSYALEGHPDERLVALCHTTFHRCEGEPALLSSVQATYAQLLAASDALGEAVTYAEQALDVARPAGDLDTVCQALRALARVQGLQHPQTGSAADELVELAQAHGLIDHAVDGLPWRAGMSLSRCDASGFRADVATAIRLASLTRANTHVVIASNLQASLALLEGRFEAAERATATVWEFGKDVPVFRLNYYTALFALRREQGRIREMAELQGPAAEVVGNPGLVNAFLGMFVVELGELDQAASLFASHLEAHSDEDLQAHIWGWMDGAVTLFSKVGDQERAARLLPLLKPGAGTLSNVAGCWCRSSVDRYLGMLTMCLGDLDAAEQHFQDALKIEQATGFSLLLARTQYWYARALLSRARGPDRGRAAELLATARSTARAVGMLALERDIDELDSP